MSSQRSENVRTLEPSATLAVGALARQLRAQGRDIVDLGAGEPDFDTPDFIARAGMEAIRSGHTRYTPVPGIPALREAIAAALAGRGASGIDPAGVVVSAGAKQALFNIAFVLFGPGDRVLVPAPYWTSYPAILQLARAEPVPVQGAESRGFKLEPADLEQAWDEQVRGLILNSPSNPSGAVYGRAELERLVEWAAGRGVRVISDEIYGRLCYTEERAASVLDLDAGLREHTVVVDGASKVFAMTGWRIGFSYSDEALAREVAALQSHTTSNASTPAQYAALAAYRASEEEERPVREMIAAFRRRRDRVIELFRDQLPELPFVQPDGAFYLFFRANGAYRNGIVGSVSFCRWLLEATGVALVPGAAFGDDRYVRLSFAAADSQLEEGIRRIGAALETLGAGPVAAREERPAEAQP
jgi:aspartate aminotransferase